MASGAHRWAGGTPSRRAAAEAELERLREDAARLRGELELAQKRAGRAEASAAALDDRVKRLGVELERERSEGDRAEDALRVERARSAELEALYGRATAANEANEAERRVLNGKVEALGTEGVELRA